MDVYETAALREEKQRRLYQNFIEDLGPLKKYFEDKSISNIKVIGYGEIIVDRFATGKEFTGVHIAPEKVKGIILSAATLIGRTIDRSTKLVKLECVLPKPYNLRFTGLLEGVENPQIALRRPASRIFTLEEYLSNEQITREQYDIVCRHIKERKNILVGGCTGSGKTTFTNAILRKMCEYTPNDSFYIVEDVPELQCPARDKTFIEVDRKCAGEAVRTALRWSPDRIIFGEVRYGEVADELIKSWNTGHTGNVTTIHADTAASMMLRMRDLIAEVIVGQIPDITKAIHLCIHLSKVAGKPPVVDEVMPVNVGDDVLLNLMRDNGTA